MIVTWQIVVDFATSENINKVKYNVMLERNQQLFLLYYSIMGDKDCVKHNWNMWQFDDTFMTLFQTGAECKQHLASFHGVPGFRF